MLTAVLALAMAMTYEARGIVWADAMDLAGAPITVSQPATYSVWVWTEAGQPATVSINGASIPVQWPESTDASGSVWTKAGEVALQAGEASVTLEGPIATVALSRQDEFDPAAVASAMRVQTTPETPADARLSIERETGTTFEMTPFDSKEAWEPYAEDLRRTLRVACGLFPWPQKTPMNAKILPVAEHDDYIVEKIYFEPFPGFLAAGNLYRPKGNGPYPGVICPHGHWETGRLENAERGSVPGRCITLARMGMVAFSYDMIGYNDSVQFSHDMKPESGDEVERTIRLLYGIHPFALQTLTSWRAIDLLQSMPCVDHNNIACTGASGGGTQTFAISAIDPRVKTAAPVNMISHTMQGGCICENAPLIRLHNSNMEIGALTAPRPMIMVSATGDWTRATLEVEYPAVKSIYALYGAEDHLDSVRIDAPHNYNQPSREAVYRFFGKWVLNKGEEFKDFTEPAFEVESKEALRLTPDKTIPEGYASGDEVANAIKKVYGEKWRADLPTGEEALAEFRANYTPALNDIIGATIPAPESILGVTQRAELLDGYQREHLILGRDGVGDALPAIVFTPVAKANGRGVVIAHGRGKGALFDLASGNPTDYIMMLVNKGYTVLAFDPFLVGESAGTREAAQRVQKAFPDTFLPTDTAYRIQDVLTAAAYLRGRLGADSVGVAGLEDAGIWALFAAALDPAIDTVAVDLHGINLDDDAAWAKRFYLPSIRSIGDVTTAAALIAPRTLLASVTGSSKTYASMRKAYSAASPNGSFITVESATTPPPGAIAAAFQCWGS